MSTGADQPLTVEMTTRDRVVIVTLAGSADMDQIELLASRLWTAAHTADAMLIVVLSDLSFICSEGLGALLKARIICRDKSAPVRLVSPSAPIRQVLTTTRLDKIMPVFDSIDAALAGE